jgi:hypothetical protein
MRLRRGRRRITLARDPAPDLPSQYFGAAAPPALQEDFPPPAAPLQEDLPLAAGAAPPAPLHELLPPAAGADAPPPAASPPPHATVEPISIPATADTARAFAMFIVLVSSLLLEEHPCLSGDSAPARSFVRAEVIEGSVRAITFLLLRGAWGAVGWAAPVVTVSPKPVPWDKGAGWRNRTWWRRWERWASA